MTSCDCGRSFATTKGRNIHAHTCPIAQAGEAAWMKAVRERRGGVQAQTDRERAIEAAKREQAVRSA